MALLVTDLQARTRYNGWLNRPPIKLLLPGLCLKGDAVLIESIHIILLYQFLHTIPEGADFLNRLNQQRIFHKIYPRSTPE